MAREILWGIQGETKLDCCALVCCEAADSRETGSAAVRVQACFVAAAGKKLVCFLPVHEHQVCIPQHDCQRYNCYKELPTPRDTVGWNLINIILSI
jgi:hypothetical protein